MFFSGEASHRGGLAPGSSHRRIVRLGIALFGLALVLLAGGQLSAQVSGQDDSAQNPVPPPLPPKPPPDDDVPEYQSVLTDTDTPWELSAELLDPLFAKAGVYAAYTDRFTCDETARMVDYKEGAAGRENIRNYGYLLTKDPMANEIREFRQRLTSDGRLKQGEVKDEEPFPPAYAWVFLFSRFNEAYFEYRYVGEDFDGFDYVKIIEFRGSLPFTSGKDIRQWEGTVIIDAVNYTPLEIRAEPVGQRDRIVALYRQYNKSFNIMGFRSGKKPLGYRATVQFRHRKDGLTFPTELRYDTFRAVSASQVSQVKASVRTYDHYRIFRTRTRPEVGEKVAEGEGGP